MLIGGGVGTAPMLYLGACLKEAGFEPTFLLGARSKDDVLQLDEFQRFGKVYITTEDGSLGEKGYVTNHTILKEVRFDQITVEKSGNDSIRHVRIWYRIC